MAVIATPNTSYSDESPVGDHFTLADIIATSYNIYNQPTEAHWINIRDQLGPLLDTLWDKIGPFTILSGYRSSALQSALTAAGEPTAAGTSFHELGLAVDIAPLSQTIDTFFGLILGQPNVLNDCGECAIKPSQNSIHITTATSSKQAVAMIMGPADNVYRRLTPEQILQYIKYPISILPIALAVTGVLALWFLKIRPSLMSNNGPARP